MTRLSRQFSVEREQLKKRLLELRSGKPDRGYEDQDSTGAAPIDFNQLLRREIELLQLLLQSPDHLDTVIENVPCSLFVEGPLRRLYEHLDDCFQNGESTEFNDLMLSVECPELKNVLVFLDSQWQDKREALTKQAITTSRTMEEIIGVFRQLEIESGSRKTILELHQQQLNEQEEISTLEELLNQTRQRHGLS